MRQPRLVKMQIRDVAIQHLLDGLGVVEHAVVSRLGQCQNTRNCFFRIDTFE